MLDDYLSRFRNKVAVEAQSSAVISDIIAQSTSKIDVYVNGSTNAIPVVFINNDKETGDESIMYSYTKDDVKIADYIKFLDTYHLVYKEVKNIKREGYIDSFKTILCNIEFNFNDLPVKAYFKGLLRSAISKEETLTDNLGVISTGEAYLMLPSIVAIRPNMKITIDDKAWKTTSVDAITNKGISYVALVETILPDETKVSDNENSYTPPEVIIDTNIIYANTKTTISTEDGYILANNNINIIKRTATEIQFSVNSTINEITIQTKSGGVIVSTDYIVRG